MFLKYILIGGLMIKVFIFLLGFGLTTIGLVYIILYLNLLTIGYNFSDYVKFIISSLECWYTIIGILLILLSTYKGGKSELYL